MSSKDWFEDWFESEWYQKLYVHRSNDEAKSAVELIHRHTSLKKGDKILDLCCGYGRHSVALADDGFEVVGLDYSSLFIQKAQNLYSDRTNARFIRGDMRKTFPNQPYDGIVNYFTSFGYFSDDAENMQTLENVYEALKLGGWFILDYFNANAVKNNFVPESKINIGEFLIVQKREIIKDIVKKTIFVSKNNIPESQFEERVKLYDMNKLTNMIADTGLKVSETIGDYTGGVFSQDTSPRCIVIAHKPKT